MIDVGNAIRKIFGKGKKDLGPKVTKENLTKFLKEVTGSVDKIFDGAESNKLEKVLSHEFETWMKNTVQKDEPLDLVSVKIGVCLGLKESLRKINEAEQKEDKVGPYIA